jgi:cytochrome c553
MKKTIIVLFLVAGAALAVYKAKGGRHIANGDEVSVQRGEYLVRLGGCTDCHTPKIMGARGSENDASRYLSGHPAGAELPPPPFQPTDAWNAGTSGMTAWAGPWGISYAPNLTPDVETGLGIWTEEIFIKTMRTGKHFGEARDILPPMPWQSLAGLSDNDLRSIFSYLKSLPPVRNEVPQAVPPGGPVSFE